MYTCEYTTICHYAHKRHLYEHVHTYLLMTALGNSMCEIKVRTSFRIKASVAISVRAIVRVSTDL